MQAINSYRYLYVLRKEEKNAQRSSWLIVVRDHSHVKEDCRKKAPTIIIGYIYFWAGNYALYYQEIY